MKKTQPNSADLTRWKPFSTTHVHKHCSINRTPTSEHFFTGSHNYVESFWWKLIFILIIMDLNAFYGIQYLHICFGLKNYLDERHFLFLFFYTNEVRKKKKDSIIAAVEMVKWFNKAFSVPSHSMKLSQHIALQYRLITREWVYTFRLSVKQYSASTVGESWCPYLPENTP